MPHTRKKIITVQIRKSKGLPKNQDEVIIVEDIRVPYIDDGRKILADDAPITQLTFQAASSDPIIQFEAITAVRKRISFDPSQISGVIKSGGLHTLVNCLRKTGTPSLVHEALWALSNIAAGVPEQTQAVVDAGAVPLLIQLLKSTSSDVCEQAVWALANITGDGPKLRDYTISNGILTPLLDLIKPNANPQLLRKVAWVLVNLSRDKQAPPTNTLKDLIPALNTLIDQADCGVLTDALWALAYLTQLEEVADTLIKMLADSGIVPKIVALLNHEDKEIPKVSLRVIGNIVAAGSDDTVKGILDSGALQHFPWLLLHHSNYQVKEALWLLSNVMTGPEDQIQAIIDTNLLPIIIHHLYSVDSPTRREALWVIRNLCVRGNSKQVTFAVTFGLIPPLCATLYSQDVEILKITLEAIESILEKSDRSSIDERYKISVMFEGFGGIDMIELLQNHENFDIYRKSYDIVTTYFSEDYENYTPPADMPESPINTFTNFVISNGNTIWSVTL